jgi:ketosteroid isomerase-like protein
MIAVVAVGVVFATGASYAQESGPTSVPAKVRKFLDNMTGTWRFDDEEGDSKLEIRWASGKGALTLIENGQFQVGDVFGTWTGLWYWDGISEDGVVGCFSLSSNRGFLHRELHGKVLSKTVMEGQGTGVRVGKKRSGNLRIEFKGPDQYTVSQTNIIDGGEKKPDSTTVCTRVKTTSDEQELTELYRVWLNAALKNDAATIGRLLADDFICGMTNGEILTKTPYLAEITSGDYQVTSMREDALKVRMYGDMALVTCIWTEKSRTKGTDTSGQYCSTDTWTRRDGRWQCMAEHISKVEKTTTDAPRPSPELKKLEGLVGDWTYKGEQAAPPVSGLPYGGAGKYFGMFTTRFTLDGFFQETKIEDNNPSGRTSMVRMTGYDAKATKYRENMYVSDGSISVAIATLDGRTWTSNSTMTTSEGKKVLIRTVEKFSSDWSSYTGTTEVSPDNGKTWKIWYTEKGKKVKK